MGTKINEEKTTDRFACPHPLTGTCERYSLYDRFHEKKQKRPEERLRSIKLLPDLASIVNSASAEQINKELSTSRYFLCQLKDIHYMFALRLYFHLHNQRINNTFLQDIQKMSNKDVHLGLHGHLLLGVDEETDKGNVSHEIKVHVVLQMLLTYTLFYLNSMSYHCRNIPKNICKGNRPAS